MLRAARVWRKHRQRIILYLRMRGLLYFPFCGEVEFVAQRTARGKRPSTEPPVAPGVNFWTDVEILIHRAVSELHFEHSGFVAYARQARGFNRRSFQAPHSSRVNSSTLPRIVPARTPSQGQSTSRPGKSAAV